MSTAIRRLKSIGTSLFASAMVATLAGCGSSTSSKSLPPPPNSTISGTYVFNASGTDPNDGLYDIAGVLTFDGKGGITSGVADYNLGSGIDSNVPLTGTYTISGTIVSATLTDGQGTQDTFTATIATAAGATITAFDGTGTGTLNAQPAAASFAPDGSYAYTLSGFGEGTLSSSGDFTVASGTITSGTQATIDGAVETDYSTITGILGPVQSNGRGQAAFNGYNFSYYPLNAGQILLVGLDDRSLVYGSAQKM